MFKKILSKIFFKDKDFINKGIINNKKYYEYEKDANNYDINKISKESEEDNVRNKDIIDKVRKESEEDKIRNKFQKKYIHDKYIRKHVDNDTITAFKNIQNQQFKSNNTIENEERLLCEHIARETGMHINEIIELKNIEKQRLEKAIIEKQKREKKKIAQEKIRDFLLKDNNIDRDIFNNIDKNRNIPSNVKMEVFSRDEGICVLCGSNSNIEFDHILPFSKGGSNSVQNIQLLCLQCNRKKHSKII